MINATKCSSGKLRAIHAFHIAHATTKNICSNQTNNCRSRIKLRHCTLHCICLALLLQKTNQKTNTTIRNTHPFPKTYYSYFNISAWFQFSNIYEGIDFLYGSNWNWKQNIEDDNDYHNTTSVISMLF